MISLGDMAQTFFLRRQTVEAKQALQQNLTEMTTGQTADISRHVRGDFSVLDGLDTSLARLAGYQSATTELGLMAQGMQSALGTINDLVSDLGPRLLTATSPSNPTLVNVSAGEAAQHFATAVSALNARVGDRSLFAGQATQGPALQDAEMILTALDTVITGLVSAQDIDTAIINWFADPAGFAAVAYQGAAPLAANGIAENETARLSVTALDPSLRDTLKGLALAAVLDRGALNGAPTARADLSRRAGEALISGQTARSELAARIGIIQAQIGDAAIRNTAERSALDIARVGIVSVDPYESATRMQEQQARLETIYTLTARLSRLSLADFLR